MVYHIIKIYIYINKYQCLKSIKCHFPKKKKKIRIWNTYYNQLKYTLENVTLIDTGPLNVALIVTNR